MKVLKILLAVTVLGAAPLASAGPDTIFLGTGDDGFLGVTSRQVVNKYMRVTNSVSAGATQIPVNDASPSSFTLVAGDLVLILQTSGTGLGTGEPVPLGTVVGGRLGQWEFGRIQSVDTSGSDSITLTEPLINSYDSDRTQVIYVPEYVSVYISGSGIIEADPWVGTMGGVVAFLVRDTLINDGAISASSVGTPAVGAGFRGGSANNGLACTVANLVAAPRGEGLDASSHDTRGRDNIATGGGGGLCDQAGGGGGGSVGAGGQGGNTTTTDVRSGEGGAGTTYPFTNVPFRLILGGGGGSGSGGGLAGGTGGGAIFIRTGSLFGTGFMTVNGRDASDSTSGGGGGGGAGGTIHLRVVNPPDCPDLRAAGGMGGDAKRTGATDGPGGGGGGGRVFLQAPDAALCEARVTVTGGQPGASTSGGARGAVEGNVGVFTPLEEPLTLPGDVVISNPTPGGFVNVRRPVITVKALASRNVYLRFSASPSTVVGPLSYSNGVYSGSPTEDLSDATHTVFAYAEYRGLVSEERSLQFQVDDTPPDTLTPTTRPPNPTNSSSARFVLAASETTGVTFQCSLGDSTEPATNSYVSCTQDTTFHGLTPGSHTLWMRAIDSVGNVDETPASFTWEIDQQAPAAPVITAPGDSAFVNDATPDIQGTRDSDAGVIVYIDDAPDALASNVPTDGGVNWTLTPSTLAEGPHSVRALAKDPAGNVSPYSVTVPFIVDTVPPTVSFTYPDAGVRLRDDPLVIRGMTEPGSSVAITLLRQSADGGTSVVAGAGGTVPSVPLGATAGTAGEWRYEIPSTVPLVLSDEDTFVVRARATDRATNSSADVDQQFTLDRKPPDTVIGCPASRFINADTVSFTLGTNGEAAQSYECVLEMGASTPVSCGGTLTLDRSGGVYGDGVYTLRARARDSAGNVDPFAAACTWTWDQTPPGPVTISGPPAVTDSTLAVFNFSASDDGDLSAPVKYECLLWDPRVPIDPASSFNDCTNPYPLTVPTEGDHLLRVRAKDLAGNVSTEERSYSWTVDTRLPVPVILRVSGADNPTNAQRATFQLQLKIDVEDPTQIVYRYTDDPTVTNPSDFVTLGGTSVEIDTPTEGEYFIQVLAQDTARGLETPRELWDSWTWKVDRTPPSIEIADKPTTWERVQTARFVFSAPGELTVQGFRCTISDCSPMAQEPENCTEDKEGARASFQVQTGLQEGRNCINVWAVDQAGNLSATPASYEWNVDTQAPEPPTITTTQPGELKVSTRSPTVEGISEPYADVAVLLDNASDTNKPVWVSANEQGRWKAFMAQEVSDGSHTLRAWAKDRAGNEGRESEPVTLLVDSQSPARVIGGGVGCTSSGSGGSLLALMGLARLLCRGRARRLK